ncbi:MAG TPA: hypothetical protein VIZ68_06570 [Thermoplasmata archaeon]
MVILAFLAASDPALLGLGGHSSTQVVLPAGTTQNLSGGSPQSFHEFVTLRAGTIEGSFSITGGPATVYICNASEFSQGDTFGPSGHLYSSGPVTEGALEVHLNATETYFIGGWPEPGQPSASWPPTPVILTWTSPLEFVY